MRDVSSSAESRLTASIRRVRKEAVPSISLRTRASAISPQCFITSDAVTAVGAAISVLVLSALKRTHVFSSLEGALR